MHRPLMACFKDVSLQTRRPRLRQSGSRVETCQGMVAAEDPLIPFLPFVVGDPEVRFDTHTPLTYETTGEIGHPIWKDIFGYILRQCSYLTAFDTVYVMVDTCNLMSHATVQDGLPHWPAAVAWWHSRLQLVGPMQEKTELLFFPACEQIGTYPSSVGAT